MTNDHLAQLLDKAAGTLIDLASELRDVAQVEFGKEREDDDPRIRARLEIARRVHGFWRGVSLEPRMDVGGLTVDLGEAQGRWELVILAMLRAARVKESVVVETFARLRDKGLCDFERLLAASPKTQTAVRDTFDRSYKALGRKDAKVEALFSNARLVDALWSGDLNTLYAEWRGDDEAIIEGLRRLRQVDRVAFWICRTLRVHGVWPDVGDRCVQYFDRYVRMPLARLSMTVDAPAVDSRDQVTSREAADAVERWFAGDPLPAYLTGVTLCAQNDAQTCLGECPVATWCRYPKRTLDE